MPNRILNSSICTSDSIDELDFFQESFFYRLLVTVDDYGNFDARSKIIRAAVFPLKDVSLKDIETALRALERQGMLQYYTVNGRRYIHLTGWARFQRLRNSKHKFPAPDSNGAEIEPEWHEEAQKAEIEDIDELESEEEEAEIIEEDSKDEENARETEENVENEQKSGLNGEKPDTLIAKTTGQDEGKTADYIDHGLYSRPACDNSPQLAATRGELATTGGNLRLARAQNPNPNPNPNTKDIMSGNPDDADGVSAPKQAKKAKLAQDAKLVIDYLNAKTGSKYRYSKSSTKHIIARLGEGFTVDDCKSVIDKKCNEWLTDPKMQQYLRPETLFAGKFEGYLNQAPAPPRASGDRERLRWRGSSGDDLPF